MNLIGRRGTLDTGRPSPEEILAAIGPEWDGDPLMVGEVARLVCCRRGHPVGPEHRVEDLRLLIPFGSLTNVLERLCRDGRLVRYRVGEWQRLGFAAFAGEARTERWGYATPEKFARMSEEAVSRSADRSVRARRWAREEVLRRSAEWLEELEAEWYAAHPETEQEKTRE